MDEGRKRWQREREAAVAMNSFVHINSKQAKIGKQTLPSVNRKQTHHCQYTDQSFREIQPYSVWSSPREGGGGHNLEQKCIMTETHCTASLKFKYQLLSRPLCMSRRTLLWCTWSRYTINKEQKSLLGAEKLIAILQTVFCLHALILLSWLEPPWQTLHSADFLKAQIYQTFGKDIEDLFIVIGRKESEKASGIWELNPGPNGCATNHQRTISSHNPYSDCWGFAFTLLSPHNNLKCFFCLLTEAGTRRHARYQIVKCLLNWRSRYPNCIIKHYHKIIYGKSDLCMELCI